MPKSLGIDKPIHIKSRDRVEDLGEVFTQPREVDAMLDLIPDAFLSIDTRFLEPAAGDGNFLVSILERKISLISEPELGGTPRWFEFAILRCLASIYSVDISEDNVSEARERLLSIALAATAFDEGAVSEDFYRAAQEIVRTNIVLGDSLNAADQILFVEYMPTDIECFERNQTYLQNPPIDLLYEPPAMLSTVHFSRLGK